MSFVSACVGSPEPFWSSVQNGLCLRLGFGAIDEEVEAVGLELSVGKLVNGKLSGNGKFSCCGSDPVFMSSLLKTEDELG